jgi:hypothetical protein
VAAGSEGLEFTSPFVDASSVRVEKNSTQEACRKRWDSPPYRLLAMEMTKMYRLGEFRLIRIFSAFLFRRG